MGLSHSPRIITDGLVFAYDMGNPLKSWKGAPTNNLAAGVISTGNGNVPTITVIDIKPDGRMGEVREHSAETIVDPNRTVSIGSWSLTSDLTYTLSFYVKNISCSGFNGNLYSPTSNVLGGITYPAIFTDRWTRVIRTFTVPSGFGSAYIFSPQAFRDGGLGKFRLTDIQLEQNSFATPYINGTRSSTQAIVDLTNNNTITATSLTYASDGTFSFNGSSNAVVFPENTALNTQAPAVEVWVKTNSLSQNGFWFEKGNVNSQYSLFQEGGNIVWRTNDGTTFVSLYLPSGNITTTNYSQVLATIEGGLKKIYVNGVLKTSVAWSSTIPTNPNGCSIGVYGGFGGSRGYYYNGSIDSVKVYNRALSAAEVKQNFNAIRGRYGI